MTLVGFYRPIVTLSMRAFGPRNSAYAFWTTTDTCTYIYIYISREISIEHRARFARPITWQRIFSGYLIYPLIIFLGIWLTYRSHKPRASPSFREIYVIGRAKRAPRWGVQSRFHVIIRLITRVSLEYDEIFHE